MSPSDHVEAVLLKLFNEAKQDPAREFLVLGEIAALQDGGRVPVPVDLMHMGILFELNGMDRDMIPGHLELDTFLDFVRRCDKEEKEIEHDAPSYFKYIKEARSMIQIIDIISNEGIIPIVTWLLELIRQNAIISLTYRKEDDSIDLPTIHLLGRILHLDKGWEKILQDDAKVHGTHEFYPLHYVEMYLIHFMDGYKTQLSYLGDTFELNDKGTFDTCENNLII